jgi:UDP-galactopyranose mutase
VRETAVDLLVVGAGPTGCVLAERAASQFGWRVLVVEKRGHVGGNCHDPFHSSGVRIHRYGPHYFRTSSPQVVAYLSCFTEWIPANYQVKSFVNGALHPFPINLDTLEQFFKRTFTAQSARAFLEERRGHCDVPQTSLTRMGYELYEAFYLNYTMKQWGRHPRQLDPSVCGRVPIRFNRTDCYVDHHFQQMPRNGFTALFERMLFHPGIEVRLNCNYADIRNEVHPRYATVYCGPIDAFFDCRHGRLPWRSLDFEFKEMDMDFAQPCVQINYPNDHEYTRSVEIKHITGQQHCRTVLAYEFPGDEGEPYYPVPGPESKALFSVYQSLAQRIEREKRIFFAGRLGTYEYIDMDEAILRALDTFERKISPLAVARRPEGSGHGNSLKFMNKYVKSRPL